MSKVFDIPPRAAEGALVDEQAYEEMYRRSVADPEGFWAEMAERFLLWDRRWERTLEWDFRQGKIQWFIGGRLNVCVNCVDRHLETRGDKVALLWEGNEPGDVRSLTYRQLHFEVCRFANVLKARGIGRGDRVAIYMPMVPEVAIAMLACARIGAIHSVVFAGFSAESLKDRIQDASCTVLVTANEGLRGAKRIPLKEIADEAVEKCPTIRSVLVYRRTDASTPMRPGRDEWIHEAVETVSADCPPESMDAEDPLFVLYTSGSTGKPKGAVHTQAGYLLFNAATHKYVFDCREDDIYFCTADVGWVTGHSYIVYGPLCNGATSLMFESIPTYPDAGRFWDIVERHRVTILYTAPTAIRSLEKEGDAFVRRYDRSSLRVLGSVGEPINEDAWLWYHNVVGEGQCAVVDTWWQTETGGILISPLPGAIPTKPGSATKPFFGIQPCIMDDEGNELEGGGTNGKLCIKFPWPGQMRTVLGDHQRFIETYFTTYPGKYFSGDAAQRDEDGYYWIRGRVDDVINVSGHRLGTAEIESAINHSDLVVEAAVVGMPHDVKGMGVYAYCVAVTGGEITPESEAEVRSIVRKVIGPIAVPDHVQFVSGLPKTRSGKIMRRILRKIAAGDVDNLGDLTTLADPGVVDEILAGAKIAPNPALKHHAVTCSEEI